MKIPILIITPPDTNIESSKPKETDYMINQFRLSRLNHNLLKVHRAKSSQVRNNRIKSSVKLTPTTSTFYIRKTNIQKGSFRCMCHL